MGRETCNKGAFNTERCKGIQQKGAEEAGESRNLQ